MSKNLHGNPFFCSSSSNSLHYTPSTTIGNKIVVVLSEEVINHRVWMWENLSVGQLIDAKLPYAIVYRLIEKIWGKMKCPRLRFLKMISFISNLDVQNLLNESYPKDHGILVENLCSSVNGLQVLFLNPLFSIIFLYGSNLVEFVWSCGQNHVWLLLLVP